MCDIKAYMLCVCVCVTATPLKQLSCGATQHNTCSLETPGMVDQRKAISMPRAVMVPFLPAIRRHYCCPATRCHLLSDLLSEFLSTTLIE